MVFLDNIVLIIALDIDIPLLTLYRFQVFIYNLTKNIIISVEDTIFEEILYYSSDSYNIEVICFKLMNSKLVKYFRTNYIEKYNVTSLFYQKECETLIEVCEHICTLIGSDI